MIAHIADDRLNDQARKRCGQEKERNFVWIGAKILVDPAHIGPLQIPTELDPEEPDAHIDDLYEAEFWFCTGVSS